MTKPSVSNVRSMTGQGHAVGPCELGQVHVELRTVNHRGFKCSIRCSDALGGKEAAIESVVKASVRRGSVHVSVSLERSDDDPPARINSGVLASYVRQCQDIIASVQEQGRDAGPTLSLEISGLTSLPGVLSSTTATVSDPDRWWPDVRNVLSVALEKLVSMRQQEGANMAQTLQAECDLIAAELQTVRTLAPRANENYRARLQGKVQRTLAEHDLKVDRVDLLREVQIYADRSDVSEEITRLESHLQLFASVLTSPGGDSGDEPTGRKLDFITQEMFRETNTIGSKAGDPEVSARVVEIKCAIERMRELVQNLE
ncbi:YicC/YloC family endoribonuclease [Roseiconus nitratireducens]|nr:YicC/YloC family endoribonuclease [Roseiconus nitratireducens]